MTIKFKEFRILRTASDRWAVFKRVQNPNSRAAVQYVGEAESLAEAETLANGMLAKCEHTPVPNRD